MNEEEQALYDEGYQAYFKDQKEDAHNYKGLDAEFYTDGWQDAQDDEANDER